MTYLEFHIYFLLPAIIVLAAFVTYRKKVRAGGYAGMILLVAIAVIYTTPWDNYLVATSVWSYGADRVIGTLGYVPIEEYLFFILQTILVCLWYFAITDPTARVETDLSRLGLQRRYGVLARLVIAFAGGVMIFSSTALTYLGLILVWALPVLALQWYFGAAIFSQRRKDWYWTIVPPTVFLWIADGVALRQGIWNITEATTTGLAPFGLPVEEALFFLLTTIMVAQGIMLIDEWVAMRRQPIPMDGEQLDA